MSDDLSGDMLAPSWPNLVSLRCYFLYLKHYLDTDTALKVSQSVYCFTTSISHGIDNYRLRLWGTGISDAIFLQKQQKLTNSMSSS